MLQLILVQMVQHERNMTTGTAGVFGPIEKIFFDISVREKDCRSRARGAKAGELAGVTRARQARPLHSALNHRSKLMHPTIIQCEHTTAVIFETLVTVTRNKLLLTSSMCAMNAVRHCSRFSAELYTRC